MTKYLVLTATIITATAHHDAVYGCLNQKRMTDLYNRNKGFTVQFNEASGTHSRLTLDWKHVIELVDNLLVFDPPLDGCRLYHKCFYDKTNIKYVKRVFYNLAKETKGDIYTSSALTLAYTQKTLQMRENKIHDLKTQHLLVTFDETTHSCLFFCVFDNMCQRCVLFRACGFGDYNKSIIVMETYDYFSIAEENTPLLYPQNNRMSP